MTVLFLVLLLVLVPVLVLLTVFLLKQVRTVFGLVHPWWTHAPAVFAFWAMALWIAFLAAVHKWPVRYEHHVNVTPTAGSFAAGILPIILLLIGVSVFIDELWARQEGRKTFNWMSLFDEAAVGIIIGDGFTRIRMMSTPSGGIEFRLQITLWIAGVLLAAAFLLELIRRYVPHEDYTLVEDTGQLEEELARRVKAGERVAYWETQNPAYVSWLVAAVSVTMLAFGIGSWKQMPWLSVLLFVVAGGIFLVYGGLRVLVSREFVQVTLGVFRLRLLTVRTEDITEVAVHAFAPLKDFGGYGIRGNREMKAYFFRGNRGVKLTTKSGKRFLIGSDSPEKLSAVIRAVAQPAHPE